MTNNLDVVQAVYDAFRRADFDSAAAQLADDAVWLEPDTVPHCGTYRGPDEIRKIWEQEGEWDDFAVVPEDFVVDGDTVVALGHYQGTFRPTGKSMRAPFAHVWRLRDGRVVRHEPVIDTGEIAKVFT